MSIEKPLLKWVGGKSQLIDNLLCNFPTKIKNYHEIFMGGGSVIIALLSYINSGKIEVSGELHCYDINKTLISFYNNIKTNPNSLISELNILKNIFISLDDQTDDTRNIKPTDIEEAMSNKESYYFWIRKKYNNMTEEGRTSVLGSAYFLFLNKTCFRGLHRVGPNGFNVPYGNYKNPEIYNEEHIRNISRLIQRVNFHYMSFKDSISNVKKGDFVYLDPPYVPINKKSFDSYNVDGFSNDNHKELFSLCDQMKRNKVKFIMSNSNTDMVLEHFKNYNIIKVEAKRSINSKKPESTETEVIIVN
jgi:DNA adenine methylase